LRASRTPNQPIWEFRYREKPRILHLMVGSAVTALSYAFLWLDFRFLMSDAVTQMLSAGQIFVTKSFTSEAPQLVVRLLDGSDLTLALTWQRSGLGSIAIFAVLFLFLVFPLQCSIWRKIAWLELGFIIGLTWSFIRLSTTVLVAYCFGTGAFAAAEFFTWPFTDFFWMVSVWSLALSAMVSAKCKQVS